MLALQCNRMSRWSLLYVCSRYPTFWSISSMKLLSFSLSHVILSNVFCSNVNQQVSLLVSLSWQLLLNEILGLLLIFSKKMFRFTYRNLDNSQDWHCYAVRSHDHCITRSTPRSLEQKRPIHWAWTRHRWLMFLDIAPDSLDHKWNRSYILDGHNRCHTLQWPHTLRLICCMWLNWSYLRKIPLNSQLSMKIIQSQVQWVLSLAKGPIIFCGILQFWQCNIKKGQWLREIGEIWHFKFDLIQCQLTLIVKVLEDENLLASNILFNIRNMCNIWRHKTAEWDEHEMAASHSGLSRAKRVCSLRPYSNMSKPFVDDYIIN